MLFYSLPSIGYTLCYKESAVQCFRSGVHWQDLKAYAQAVLQMGGENPLPPHVGTFHKRTLSCLKAALGWA